MSPRYQTVREFVIYIQDEITPEEAEEYPSWTKFNDVADVSDKDLRLYGFQPLGKTVAERLQQNQAALINSKPLGQRRPSVRFDLEPKPPFGYASPREQALVEVPQESPAHSPLPAEPTAAQAAVASPTSSRSPSPAADRLVVPLGTLPDPQSSNEDNEINLRLLKLADLIPPDISILNLNSNDLFVPLPNGELSDSVSYIDSNDDDY